MTVTDESIADSLFANLRFLGNRFSGANLPVDHLMNVAAYLSILRELAIDIWHEKHPERSRLPRGFREQMSLSFVGVQEGSAKAILRRDPNCQPRLLMESVDIDYLSLAQTRFLAVARAANDNRSIATLPSSIRNNLRLLLAEVSEDEGLEITSLSGKDSANPSVRYSPKTRDRLLGALRVSGEGVIDGLGIVSAIDDAQERVKITSEHGIFWCPIDRSRLRSDFAQSLNRIVEFVAYAKTSSSGGISSIERVTSLDLVEFSPEVGRLLQRLDHIAGLGQGWKDGKGVAVDPKALHFAKDLASYLGSVYQDLAAFPTLAGGVAFEFKIREISAAVLVTRGAITLEAFDESDSDPVSASFFAITPKLLKNLIDLEAFIK